MNGNPMTLYCLWQLSGGIVRRMPTVHFGPEFFSQFGEALIPTIERTNVLPVFSGNRRVGALATDLRADKLAAAENQLRVLP